MDENFKVKIAELEIYRQELEESCELLKGEMKNDEVRLLMEQTGLAYNLITFHFN